MVTVNEVRFINGRRYIEVECLSTDTKPTDGVMNGSKLLEIDTGKLYIFDEENQTWRVWPNA